MNEQIRQRIMRLNIITETSKMLCPVCLRIMERNHVKYHNCVMEISLLRLTGSEVMKKNDEFGCIIGSALSNYESAFRLMGMYLRRQLNRDATRMILLYLHKTKKDYLLWYSLAACEFKKKRKKNGLKQRFLREVTTHI